MKKIPMPDKETFWTIFVVLLSTFFGLPYISASIEVGRLLYEAGLPWWSCLINALIWPIRLAPVVVLVIFNQ